MQPGTRDIRNRLLVAGPGSRVTLAKLPLTPRRRQARLLWCRERSTGRWDDALLSSVMRVGSACMRVMDVHARL